jgi:hypothetical protein
MKLFFGLAVSAGVVVAAGCANAQTVAPSEGGRARFQATSDFQDPNFQDPNFQDPNFHGPHGPPPMPPGPPPRRYGYRPVPDDEGYGPQYGRGPQYGYGPDLMPLPEVYAVLRENGFSPLGIPRQRGFVYVIAALDRTGQDGRLVIDGRSGQIIRFMPAYRWGFGYERMRYQPGPPPPPYGERAALPEPTVITGAPPPPAPTPRLASRSVPMPAQRPVAASKPAETPQQSAAVAMKPADAAQPAQAAPAQPPAAATSPQPSATIGQSKPAAQILPTQEMPKAQGLE